MYSYFSQRTEAAPDTPFSDSDDELAEKWVPPVDHDEDDPEEDVITEEETEVIESVYQPDYQLYIRGIPYDTTDKMLANFFEPYGRILDLRSVKNHDRTPHYGFVRFATLEEMRRAQTATNNAYLNGANVKVVITEENTSVFLDRIK